MDVNQMNNLSDQQQTNLQITLTNYLQQVHLLQIDSNLNLKIKIKITKNSQYLLIICKGSICYKNGQPLQISQSYSKIINQYHQLQKTNFIISYCNKTRQICICSKFYKNNLFNTINEINQINQIFNQNLKQIYKKIKRLVDLFNCYGLINTKNRNYYKQSRQEIKLIMQISDIVKNKKRFIEQIQSLKDKLQIKKQLQVKKQLPIKQQQNSQIVDLLQTSNTVFGFQQDKDKFYGSLSLRRHFQTKQASIITMGGYFNINKKLCSVQNKRHQTKKQFNQSINAEKIPNQPNFQVQKKILVCKSLKEYRLSLNTNRYKLQKEKIIMSMIENKKYLVKTYPHDKVYNKRQSLQSQLTRPQSLDSRQSFESAGQQESEQSKQAMLKSFLMQQSILQQSLQMKSLQQQKGLTKSPILQQSTQIKQQQTKNKQQLVQQIWMQFIPHTLNQYINYHELTFDQKLTLSNQLIQAILHINTSYIIHRDLKATNILVDFNTNPNQINIKIIDFAQSSIHVTSQKKHDDYELTINSSINTKDHDKLTNSSISKKDDDESTNSSISIKDYDESTMCSGNNINVHDKSTINYTKDHDKSGMYSSMRKPQDVIFGEFHSSLYSSTSPYSPFECQMCNKSQTDTGINNFEIDAWSIAIVIFEIFHQKRAVNFKSIFASDIRKLIKNSKYELYLPKYRKKGIRLYQTFVNQLMSHNLVWDQSKRHSLGTTYHVQKILNEKINEWLKQIKDL